MYIMFNYNFVYNVFTSSIHSGKIIFFSNINKLSDIEYIYMFFLYMFKIKIDYVSDIYTLT